ncbi:MAG: rhodanese-like domain-containing protein [Gammaproteobacteria bacterium]|nr:rhodanese-like domain-containing protein [Gammaproteobacteria bacterium]
MAALCGALIVGLIWGSSSMAAGVSKISSMTPSLKIMHKGRWVVIRRLDGQECPPMCVQPISIMRGVDTIGELEVLDYLRLLGTEDDSILVIDSRLPEKANRGTIPGAVNIPWNMITVETGDSSGNRDDLSNLMMERFSVHQSDGKWNFDSAKTLVLFSKGITGPQSSVNIKTLAKLGYPLSKLKWYRGGVDSWVAAGLTTVSP